MPPGVAPWLYALAMGLTWLSLVLPVLVARFPPLHDYPNHLARTFILGHLDDPSFARHFTSAWLPYPNLAVDALGTPLGIALPPELAGRLFLVLLPTLYLLGAHRIGRALHGGLSLGVPLASFVFFNTLYFYGFVNYVFGVGFFLLAWSFWLDAHQRPTTLRLVLTALVAVVAYLAHKTAFAFLAVAVVTTLALEGRRLGWRQVLVQLAVLVPAGLLDLLSPVPKVAIATEWESPLGKVKGLASLISTYSPLLDVALTLLLLAAIVVAWRRRGLDANRTGLVIAGVLAVLFVVFPTGVGGTWAADRRFLVPAAAVALISLRFDMRPMAVKLAALSAIGLVLLRGGIVASEWVALSDDIGRRVRLLEQVPPGARIYGFAILDKKNKATWTRQMGLVYAHQYAALDRKAFVSGLFANLNQQPLRVREDVEPKDEPALDRAPEAVDWAAVFASHEYVFATKLDDRYAAFLGPRCQLLGSEGDAALYKSCRP